MSKKALIYGFVLDINKKVIELDFNKLKNYKSLKDNLVWLHFDYKNPEAYNWIREKSNIDEVAIDALLLEDTRPRTIILNDAILLTLRGVNLNPNSSSEDMISLRLYISENLIISTQKRNLFSVNDLANSLRTNKGPTNASEFMIFLTDKLTYRITDFIDVIEEKVINIEEQSLDSNNIEFKNQISSIRRETINLKKYLYPQKEAMSKLYHNNIPWLNEYQKIQLREVTEQLILNIEELETINDKVSLVQEEFSNKLNEQMNQRIYILSVISAIFLPLGFLTGLLGINIGGIPGTDNKNAFLIFSIILCIIVSIQIYYFKKKKWI